MKLLTTIAFNLVCAGTALLAQTTEIEYGSALQTDFTALFFADTSGTLLSDSNNGVIAVGTFSSINDNMTLDDWRQDFSLIDFFNFDGIEAPFEGFGFASFQSESDLSAQTPYIFYAVGINDWADITSANVSSFGIFTDSTWSFAAPASPTPSSSDFRQKADPDTILVGSLVSNPSGFQINASPIPEPSALHLFALGSLGFLLRRRRRS